MKIQMDSSGLNRNAVALSGTRQIKLFDGVFMWSNPRFSSFEQIVNELGLEDVGAAT